MGEKPKKRCRRLTKEEKKPFGQQRRKKTPALDGMLSATNTTALARADGKKQNQSRSMRNLNNHARPHPARRGLRGGEE